MLQFPNQFPFHSIEDQIKHATEQLKQLDQLMKHDVWRQLSNLENTTNLNSLNQQSKKQTTETSKGNQKIPCEVWETKHQFYIYLFIPSSQKKPKVNISFPDSVTVRIQGKVTIDRPSNVQRLLTSEINKGLLEREITLSKPISTKSYSTRYTAGIFTLILNKQDEEEKDILDDPYEFIEE